MSDKDKTCEHCINSRLTVSENGYIYRCTINRFMECQVAGTEDYFVAAQSAERD